MEIKSILQRYELYSGQAINLNKSGIYFSSNVRVDKQEELKNLVGVYNDLSTGNYLGLPSLIGRSKKLVFNFLKDRLWCKIQSWSAKCLSKASKAILLRSVAQAIPSYAMSCFLLPRSLCSDLEKMMNSYWWGSHNINKKGIKWTSWTNMSMAKEKRGLAFRDLHGFNLALLRKKCWNLVHNLGSLVARVFKEKYFTDSSLFEASRGGGVSFVWSGLWQAKEAFKQGFRWVVGDARSISASSDAWLRDKKGHRIDEQSYPSVRGLKVCDLFVPGRYEWDAAKVHNLFLSSDAKCILATPIPNSQVQDLLVWSHSLDGKYSAKSGYKFWQQHFSKCKEIQESKGWGRLWKIQVPQKVKMFLWRVCRNNVPVRIILRGRGVNTPILCPLCGVDVEHLRHICLECSFVRGCWDELGLDLIFPRLCLVQIGYYKFWQLNLLTG